MTHVKCQFAFAAKLEAGYQCPWHDHPCTELVYTGETSGVVQDGRRNWRFKPRQVFSYQAGGRHRVRIDTGGEHGCIGVQGCGAESIPQGVWDASETIIGLFQRCRQIIAGGDPLREQRLDLLTGLIVLELRTTLQPADDPAAVADYALQARRIIEARFDERLSLNDIASHLYISPDYLRQLFRKRFGQSPIHYLIRKRIEAAQQLLADTDLSIREIGLCCGFANPYYFSRMFRKVTGQTALEYRRGPR